jgi:hypothetical protein
MSKDLYKQCGLSKQLEDGVATQVAWIPVKFAEVGKYLKLDNEPADFQDGWRVEDVTEPAVEEHILVKNSQDYKKTRKASDI